MSVKVVTDSLSDITSDMAEGLGITVVPLTVSFGKESFLDRITITTDEFYHKLTTDPNWPITTQPPPGDFVNVYNKLAEETDEILVITLSSKLSGTYESALNAKSMLERECRVEVIDSLTVAMALGLIVITAAKAAQAGAKLDELVALVRRAMSRSHLIAYFDTLKYLAKGGRIGKAQALLGSVLNVKPMLTIKDGELVPAGRVRNRTMGIDRLFDFVKNAVDVQDLAIVYNTTPDEALALAGRMGSLFPEEKIRLARLGPALGVHGGPGILFVSLRGGTLT